jgi:BirA family transcriptional regulator, biotin operon repressor / biotin---[acetyl-CoA-carboxylase] ligase
VTVFPASSLAAALAKAGHRALHVASCESTMSEAARQAEAGAQGPLWIIADVQTQGRGRHGRLWQSPAGNLHATMLLTDGIPARDAAQIGFVAGLALHDAVARLTGLSAPRLALKWPNDLLVARAKCAGLLLEGSTAGSAFRLCIGFGVNTAAAPEDLPYEATHLSAHAPLVPRDAVMLALANSFAERLALWHKARETGVGFAVTLDAWRERAAFSGETVTLRLPSGSVTGVFGGVDAEGRLVLVAGGERHLFDAGDLFFGDAPG